MGCRGPNLLRHGSRAATIEHVSECGDVVVWDRELVAAGCPDPARCTGHQLRLRADTGCAIGAGWQLRRVEHVALPCPVASVLHRLREAPVTAGTLGVLAAGDPARLSPAEQVDLLRMGARASTWVDTRVSDLAAAVVAAVPDLLLPTGEAESRDGAAARVLTPRPWVEEAAVALHSTPGSARWRVDAQLARQRRAPALAAALREGSAGPAHARELDAACQGLPDEAAGWVAARVHRVLLTGTRGQVAGAARRAVTVWHASHPDPAGPTAEDPDDPLLPEPLGGRAARNVQSWPAGQGDGLPTGTAARGGRRGVAGPSRRRRDPGPSER